jgi:hypothetical protein
MPDHTRLPAQALEPALTVIDEPQEFPQVAFTICADAH